MTSRYKLAVAKAVAEKRPNKELRAAPTKSVPAIKKALRFCNVHNLIFKSENQPQAIMNKALISLSKETGVPILVATDSDAMALSTAYSHKAIYSFESYTGPSKQFFFYGIKEGPRGARAILRVE